MIKKRRSSSEIGIDESKHVAEPSYLQRMKDALYGIILGIVLVQMFYFWGAFQSGNVGTTSSVVHLADNLYFLVFLAFCGGMGWFRGPRFHQWLNVRISYW